METDGEMLTTVSDVVKELNQHFGNLGITFLLKHYSKAISQLITTSYKLNDLNENKG